MRSLTRLGVAAAATAIASATALAGAGVAGAQDVDPVFNSPSSVSVSGKGEATEVTYTNKSGQDLMCYSFVGTGRLVSDLYGYVKTVDINSTLPESWTARFVEAASKGQIGFFGGMVENGETAELIEGAIGGVVEGTLTDDSFSPAALTVCNSQGLDDDRYVEVEISAGAGVPPGLGSLDSALAGIGSSGSVAETTGSLGS
ncbi:hypothetical protein NGF75_07195 [Dietzia kunjamensis]|uniref:hypothetical protein n=1 Tax=Dietzia kunjamensis TaxID=322509 RepID=UPI002DC03259|nr:hypothetical protein [Dietzia kunjamensis]MEB8325771.1 hypothetical protein [Dietzia kunjamensis]